MARNCSICGRADAGAINERLRDGRSARSVALEFGVGDDAVLRHARQHLARLATAPTEPVADRVSADPLDELVAVLRIRALAGEPIATREYRLALSAQVAARHAAIPDRDLAATDEWIALRSALLVALEPFPQARLAVAAALEGMA